MRHHAAGLLASLVCLLAIPLPHAAFAADAAPVPLAWSEPARVDTQPPYTRPTSLGDVSCPTTSMCGIAAGGEILTSTDPLGGYGRWQHTRLGAGVSVDGISCPTTTDCVAVGGDFVVTLTGLGSGAPRRATVEIEPLLGNFLRFAACPAVTYCILGDVGGRIATSEDPLGWPATWRVEQIGPNVSSLFCLDVTLCGLTDRGTLAVMGGPGDDGVAPSESPGFVMGFSCASHTFCVTMDDDEGAMVTSDPFHGPWTAAGAFGWWPVCGPPSLCLVIGDGYVMSATDPHGVWTYTQIPAFGSSTSGSCPSQDLCLITTSDGGISFSSDPTGGSRTWHAQQIAGSDALLSVACPLASLCVAFDSVGRVLTTHAPADGAAGWSAPGRVEADAIVNDLACPSATLCVGVGRGGSILSSTAPDGGAHAWKRIAVDADRSFVGVTCPSASLCVAGTDDGSLVTSTDPTGGPAAWHVTPVDPSPVAGVACPSSSLCVAADRAGRIVTSTDPTGGADRWRLATVGPDPLAAVACPSVTLCVAVDDAGGVITSSDPAGGAATWKRARVAGVDRLTALACPSASLCVAIGDDTVAMSTQPAAGAAAWDATVVDDRGALTDIACASERLCVAVDDVGDALLGTSPSPPEPAPPTVDLSAASPPPPTPAADAVTAKQLRTLLRQALAHLGKGARINALLAHGRYVLHLTAPIAGAAHIGWYAPARGARLGTRPRNPLLVASGDSSFARPQTRAIALRLTRAGRRLLRHATRIALTARGTFSGSLQATASVAIVLHR